MSARAAAILLLFATTARASSLYNLVEGLEKFNGSTTAWQLLATNGFVVTDPDYDDFSDPYLDGSLPVFITVDSAWQTYRSLTEQGVKQLAGASAATGAFVWPQPWLTNGIDARSPSGLEFLAAAGETRNSTVLKWLSKPPETVPPWPESMQGEEMKLFATLQNPLPKGVAPAMRSSAWGDLQLWTELGGWASVCHPPGTHPRMASGTRDDSASSGGMVTPYPEFFAGLARISRAAADRFAAAGLDDSFDVARTARKLLDGILWQQNIGVNSGLSLDEVKQHTAAQFTDFMENYTQDAAKNGGRATTDDLEALARRCLDASAPAEADVKVLRRYFDFRRTVPHLLNQLADACERLATLARKNREGEPLSQDDEGWIGNYGALLARLNFVTVSPFVPESDNISMIDSICTNAEGSVFHAALGHPEALYIIIPSREKLRLFRGAVMSYREFSRPVTQPMNDEQWRAQAGTGNAPAPPPFTRSFYARKTAAEILATLNTLSMDAEGLDEFTRNMEELRSRVTEKDLPALIAALAKNHDDFPAPAADGIAAAISGLNWAPRQKELLELINQDDGQHANAVRQLLGQHPEWIDSGYLCRSFAKASVPARRVYCALLGRARPNEQIRETLKKALRDPEPAVRWQAALAMGKPGADVSALLQALEDENALAAAAAGYAIGRTGETNVAPALLNRLQKLLARPALTDDELQKAVEPLRDLIYVMPGQTNFLDPDGLVTRLRPGFRRTRRFFGDVAGLERPFVDFTPIDTITVSLGELNYHPAERTLIGLLDGPHAAAAAEALERIAPEQMEQRLTALACDKTAPPSVRDEALSLLAAYPRTSVVNSLAPLLDDTTIIPARRIMPGREWRICDRAAATISTLLGRDLRIVPMQQVEQRDKHIDEVRQWLKAAY